MSKFGGLGNLGNLIKNAGKIQEVMKKKQEELSKTEVQGFSGGDLVQVTMNGRYYVKAIQINDEALKEDKTVMSELIVAAINDATTKVEAMTKEQMMEAGKIFTGGEDDINNIL